MALKKKYILWLMIPILLTAVPTAWAVLTNLPGTGEEGSIYSGASNILGPVIEFAVFDSQNANYNGINGIELDEQGRYVYVYEIFNYAVSQITYFNIYGIGEGAVDDSQDNIGTVDDGDGVDAESSYFNSDFTKATWVFGEGTLVYGQDSVFLVMYSDNPWVPGTYDFATDDEFPVMDDDEDINVPEPGTLILLSLGTLLTCRKSGKQ